MIRILDFNKICLDILEAVPGINSHIIAVHEKQATTKLASKSGVILLGVTPASDRYGKPGQPVDNNTTLLYILEKEKTGADDIVQYQKLQDIIIKIRDYIEEQNENGIPLFARYNPSATTIDPENFSGFNGWSLSLEF